MLYFEAGRTELPEVPAFHVKLQGPTEFQQLEYLHPTFRLSQTYSWISGHLGHIPNFSTKDKHISPRAVSFFLQIQSLFEHDNSWYGELAQNGCSEEQKHLLQYLARSELESFNTSVEDALGFYFLEVHADNLLADSGFKGLATDPTDTTDPTDLSSLDNFIECDQN